MPASTAAAISPTKSRTRATWSCGMPPPGSQQLLACSIGANNIAMAPDGQNVLTDQDYTAIWDVNLATDAFITAARGAPGESSSGARSRPAKARIPSMLK
jgi:hypothetical protein